MHGRSDSFHSGKSQELCVRDWGQRPGTRSSSHPTYVLTFSRALLKEKVILTLVKMVRKALFSTVLCVKTVTCDGGERSGAVLNTAKTVGGLELMSRVRVSVGGKLLRGDIGARGVLQG